MFERSSDILLGEWVKSGRRTVPLITGPRGVGKTSSVRRLGQNYGCYIEVDLSDPANMRLLAKADDAERFVSLIGELFGKGTIVPGDTLIVLDEAGLCPGLLRTLSELADRETVDLVMTASCFRSGACPDRSYTPWVEIIDVRPVDFRGFLHESGYCEEADAAERDLSPGKPSDRDLDRTMEAMFRRYLVTGGMPQAINQMISSGRLVDVRRTCREIVERQMSDARKAFPYFHDIIRGCLESVPAQLRGNGRFMYSRVGNLCSASSKHIAESIQWLSSSGILDLCHRAMDPVEPPSVRCEPNHFKAYADTGTLFCLMDGWVSDAAMNGNYQNCPCAVLENCAARQMASCGMSPSYYQRDRREADFLVPHGGEVSGVAVRSGNNGRRKSLSKLLDEGQITRAVEFGASDRPGDADRYPLWAMGFPGTVFPGMGESRSGDRRWGFTARSGPGRFRPGRSPRPSRRA